MMLWSLSMTVGDWRISVVPNVVRWGWRRWKMRGHPALVTWRPRPRPVLFLSDDRFYRCVDLGPLTARRIWPEPEPEP